MKTTLFFVGAASAASFFKMAATLKSSRLKPLPQRARQLLIAQHL